MFVLAFFHFVPFGFCRKERYERPLPKSVEDMPKFQEHSDKVHIINGSISLLSLSYIFCVDISDNEFQLV